jgi:hypothetical protein
VRLTLFGVILQSGLIVLPTVENANDGDALCIHIEGYDGSLLVIGDSQSGTHIVTLGAPVWKRAQGLAETHDRIGI